MNKDTLQDLLDKGMSLRQMSRELNHSFTNIRYWMKKHGLVKPERCGKGEKHCSICNTCKPRVDFYVKKNGDYHPYCKSCTSEKLIKKNKITKSKCVEYKGGQCEKCGYNKSQAALHFHHIDPATKSFSIASRQSCSFEELKAELDKCIMLCANCHAEEHEKVEDFGLEPKSFLKISV